VGSLLPYQSKCRRILCLSAKRRETITYSRLAAALGLKSPRQQWNTVLDPLSESEVKETGADLTLIVTYDPPPLKWSDLRYVFDTKEDRNGKEAIQA
jgi:hypothetical protein